MEPCFNLQAAEKDLSPAALVAVARKPSHISGKRRKYVCVFEAMVAGVPAKA